MKFINIFIICSVILVLTCYASIAANLSTPLMPVEAHPNSYVGLVFGAGQNMQDGVAYVNCDSCFFKGGVDWGFTAGINFERQFTGDPDSYWKYFKYGVMLLYSTKNINPAFVENTNNYLPNYDIYVPLLMKHTNKISISQIGLSPHLTYDFFDFAFVRMAVAVDYLISGNMKHEIELLEKTKILPNGEKVSVSIPVKNSNKKVYNYTVEEGNIRDQNKLQFALMPGLGFNINLSPKIILSASFNYTIPLNNISEYGENFRESTWRTLLELKYNITDTSNIYKK